MVVRISGSVEPVKQAAGVSASVPVHVTNSDRRSCGGRSRHVLRGALPNGRIASKEIPIRLLWSVQAAWSLML